MRVIRAKHASCLISLIRVRACNWPGQVGLSFAHSTSLVLIGMASKGSFSYTDTTITGFNIGNGLQIRVEAINKHVASMTVTDINGNLQPIPPGITLVDAANKVVPPWNNVFLITWIDSYALRVNGEEKIWMTNSKLQSFRTATDVTHFTI